MTSNCAQACARERGEYQKLRVECVRGRTGKDSGEANELEDSICCSPSIEQQGPPGNVFLKEMTQPEGNRKIIVLGLPWEST